jgi:large subunit ribosomal protein L21
MYAVVKTGGKQYRVSAGTKIKVEQLTADVGSEVTLDQVLMIAEEGNVKLGAPLVAGAAVKAKVLSQGRGDRCAFTKCAGVNTIASPRGIGRISPSSKSRALQVKESTSHGT